MVSGINVQKVLGCASPEPPPEPEVIEVFKFSKLNQILDDDDDDPPLLNISKHGPQVRQDPLPKKKRGITIMCPICSGGHDFLECESMDGSRVFERLYKPHPRYRHSAERQDERMDGSKLFR